MKNTKQTSKHTAGEWKVTKGTNGFCDTWQVHIETPTRSMTIADCGAITNKVFSGSTESTPVLIENKEHEANARLIASAPLMLEALERCENLIMNGSEPCLDQALVLINQAIKKAKGE